MKKLTWEIISKKLQESWKDNINWMEHKWREYFCLRKVNVFGFLQIYFLFQKNQIKMRNSLQYVFLNLDRYVKNSSIGNVCSPISQIMMMWNFDIRIPMLSWHSRIIKTRKNINLENERYYLTFQTLRIHSAQHNVYTNSITYYGFLSSHTRSRHIPVHIHTYQSSNKWAQTVIGIMLENVTRKVPATIPITKKWNLT